MGNKIDTWIKSNKKSIAKAVDILQTLAGIGLTMLAVVVAQSFFSFYQDFLLPLIPKVSQTIPVSLSGQIFVATFPLLIILTSALGIWCILETNWITKLGKTFKQKYQQYLNKSDTSSNVKGETHG